MLGCSVTSVVCYPMHCSPPGSSVHEILQPWILEWAAMLSSRGSSRPRDGTRVSYITCIGKQVLYHEHHLGSHHLRRQMTNALTVVVQSWQRLYMLSCWGFFCCCFWHQTFFLLCWFLLQIVPFPIVYERWKFQFQKLSSEPPLLSNTGWQSEHDLTLA